MKKNKTFLLILICVLMFASGFVTRSILDTPSKEAIPASHR
jgi:Na+-transporting methylmalonyl-CoA/oxaloacetate decarboxylase gamma subunit